MTLALEILENEVDDFTSRVELEYNKHLTIPKVAEKYYTLCMKEPSYKNSETFEDDKVRIDKMIRSAEESLKILNEELNEIILRFLHLNSRYPINIRDFIKNPHKILDNFFCIITETKSWLKDAIDGHECTYCSRRGCKDNYHPGYFYTKSKGYYDRRCDCNGMCYKGYICNCNGRFCPDDGFHSEVGYYFRIDRYPRYGYYDKENDNLWRNEDEIEENCFLSHGPYEFIGDYEYDFWNDDPI